MARNALDQLSKELGDGKIVSLSSGETIFKLDPYKGNPIVKPQDLGLSWYEEGKLRIGAVFNGGAEIFQDKIILTPRCHRNYRPGTFFDPRLGMERSCLEDYISEVWVLVSEDGVHFKRFQDVVIRGDGTEHQDFVYGIEDTRIIRYDEAYLLIGCGKVKPPFKGEKADRIAIYSTQNFLDISYHGIVEGFDSRNAVPFSSYILLRFHPDIHLDLLDFGLDQLFNPKEYARAWARFYDRRDQNRLLKAGEFRHEREKIGPGPQLIKTDRGWLLIYHAVGELSDEIAAAYGLSRGIERGYSVCAAILDLEDPSIILCRTRQPIYIPSAPYELYGDDLYPVDVPGVVFPMGAVTLKDKLLLYCGAGDKYITLLSCKMDHLTGWLWEDCRMKFNHRGHRDHRETQRTQMANPLITNPLIHYPKLRVNTDEI